MSSPVPQRERMAAGVTGARGRGRGFWFRGLVPMRALSSPGPSWTPAGFSNRATSGGTRWASWAPASRPWAASPGDSSESRRLFIGLLGTRILMPVLDRSTLRRAEPTADAGVRPAGCCELIEARRTKWAGTRAGFTRSQSAVRPQLISLLMSTWAAVEGGSLQGGLWVGLQWWLGELRVERSNMLSLCLSAYWRLKSWT